MLNYNKLILIGYLTRDPVLSYLPNTQTAVCEAGIATNYKWKAADGTKREEVMFLDWKAFGKTAETLAKYLKKGAAVLLEGRLQFDQWEKDGAKRSKHRMVVDRFSFMGSAADAEKPAAAQESTDAFVPADDDDIPF